jgi:hypothetical protein
MKKIIAMGLITAIAFLSISFGIIRVNAVSYKVDKLVDDMMKNYYEQIKKNPTLMLSSNPYDYTKDCPEYDAIVALGYEALPYIKEKVEKSENNGLSEYILAIAAEKIGKVKLKGDHFNWDTGKGWAREWNKHLKNLPSNFDNIVASKETSASKNEKLVRLGAPALPFIIDRIEQGDTEFIPALEMLLEDNAKAKLDKASKGDINTWIKNNKDGFEILRRIVNDAQEGKEID